MNDEHILDFYLAYSRAQGVTDRTLREREIFVRSLIRRVGKPLLEMTKYDLIVFLGRGDLTGRTRQNYKSALHLLFTVIQDEGFRADNPATRLPSVQIEVKEPNPVSTEDIEKVLHSGIRGKTVMMFLLYSYQGLRASEIAAVSGKSINWDKGTILTMEGKGRKVVTRPLHSMVLEHAIEQKYPRDDFWFPGMNGADHIRGKSVSKTLCAALKRAGILHRAHDMRKWHGTTLLEMGADSLDVQHSLRHSDAQSMKAYIRPSQDRIRVAMESLPRVKVPVHPRGRRARLTAPKSRAA
jgi:integrase/recombinase XerD